MDLTSHWVGISAIILFVVAYSLVITEEFTNLRKSKPVMLAAGIILLNGGAGLLDVSSAEVRGPAIALIVIGVLLMMPLIAVIVHRARSTR